MNSTGPRKEGAEDMNLRTITSKQQCYENFKHILANVLRDESGQDLIEYALVACVIALGAVATMTSFAGTIRTVLGSIGTKLTNAV
jgi:pilus assembly protein Flp/PilA